MQAGQPQRKLIISRNRGYHGGAYGGTSAQGIAPNKENFGPFVDEVVQVPADDVEAIATLMSQRGNEVAAIITEPVQGAGGVYPAPDGYLQSLRKLCDQHGAYLIFDEVITGFGRTGSWFAAHHYGVTPDMATFAKQITSGYIPLGGVFVGAAPTAALEADPNFFLRHGFTYSGHPTACAAGLKNLEIIRREGLVERAKHIEDRLGGGLQALGGRRRDRRRPRSRRHVGRRCPARPERQRNARAHARSEQRDRACPQRRVVHVPAVGHPRRTHRPDRRRCRRGSGLR